MASARLIIEVTRGLIPGAAPDETRRWEITDAEWERAQGDGRAHLLLAHTMDKAMRLANDWADPALTNWVRLDWVWL